MIAAITETFFTRDVPAWYPISKTAVSALRFCSTIYALALVFYTIVNLEVLLLYTLAVKQRAYSALYKEFATPVLGPVFVTQIKYEASSNLRLG
jgi:hypothetical protein